VTCVEQKIKEGFDAYYAGKSYSVETNMYWHQGWIKAERTSRCGRLDRYGRVVTCFG
jgi:hypothetical protein